MFGDVVVNEGEEVSGQVVAVLGSVRIDGEVGDQVVAVLGSVDLGPHAVVHGDVVTVGGRLRRAPGSQVNGAVTEVSLGGMSARGSTCPGSTDGGLSTSSAALGRSTRLVGTTFRFVLLALVACLALVVRAACRGRVRATRRGRPGEDDAGRPRRLGAVRAAVRARSPSCSRSRSSAFRCCCSCRLRWWSWW